MFQREATLDFKQQNKMFSVVETSENGNPMAVGVQTLWLKNGKLYWPPGKNPDRKTPSSPQTNWIAYDYKLLKTSIGKRHNIARYDYKQQILIRNVSFRTFTE